MSPFRVSEPFAPRPVTFDGVREHDGWRLKLYSVLYEGTPLNRAHFADGEAMALAVLPSPAVTAQRPGLGLLIRHQGRGMDYAVLCWWDRENECPIHVFVDDGQGWRPARKSESFCVWDLEILWGERNAYVGRILSNTDQPDIDGYLAAAAVS